MEANEFNTRTCIQCSRKFQKSSKEGYHSFSKRIYCSQICVRDFNSWFKHQNELRRSQHKEAMKKADAQKLIASKLPISISEEEDERIKSEFGALGNRAIENSLTRNETERAGA